VVTDLVEGHHDFWKKSKEELATLLENSGVKKDMLEKDIDEFMVSISKDLKASLPRRVDALTILDSLKIEKKSFKYEYLILESDKIQNPQSFQTVMEKLLKAKACSDLFSVYLLKNGVVISHNYRDKIDNRLLASVKIKDCQALSSKE